MVPLAFLSFEHFFTHFAWEAPTLMTSNVFIEVVFVVETFPTHFAEMQILACMMLHMPIESVRSPKGFTAFGTRIDFFGYRCKFVVFGCSCREFIVFRCRQWKVILFRSRRREFKLKFHLRIIEINNNFIMVKKI